MDIVVPPLVDALPKGGGYASVHCLDGGSFIGNWSVLHANVVDFTFRMYNWSYHVHDASTDRHILWDVGMSSDLDAYSPWCQKLMAPAQARGPRQSLEQQLARRGVTKNQIDSIVFSHAHWDHCRPVRPEFPKAEVFFGPGTRECCSPGHFEDPENIQWDGRFFDPHGRATEKFEELNGPWVRLGAFEKAFDFFGTGSFWIVQAPGHMPGNLLALVRQADDEWILLGSDCCHSRPLLDGKLEIATWPLPNGGVGSLQADIPAAKDTISRIRIMESQFGCHVSLAHDTQWMSQGTDSVLMGMLDADMKESVRTKLPKHETF